MGPNEATICKGDSVTWVLNKAGPHNVQFTDVPDGVEAEDLGCGLLGEEGQTYTQKFDVAGQYGFVCSPHGGAGMVGDHREGVNVDLNFYAYLYCNACEVVLIAIECKV